MRWTRAGSGGWADPGPRRRRARRAAGIAQKDKIYAPPAPQEFAGQLVVGTDYPPDRQVQKLIKVFQDPRVQPYLSTTTDPGLVDQLSPMSPS